MEFLLGISLFLNIFILFAVGCLVNSLQEEKKDILNRLMAKDYHEYAVFEANKEVRTEHKPLIEDEQESYQVI
jgi:hypothetical protein